MRDVKTPGLYSMCKKIASLLGKHPDSFFKTVQVKSNNERLYTLLISYDPKKPIVMEASNVKIGKGRELSGSKREVVLGYNYQLDDVIFSKAIIFCLLVFTSTINDKSLSA